MSSRILTSISLTFRHIFHVLSNVRPLVWICLYIVLIPIFALFYWAMPDAMFRLPDGGTADYGSWLYYSIVTISTLGFGDYTPMHPLSQGVTAIEVMCGLIILGLFLNAVGAMKSEIDVESEMEKQRRLHFQKEKEQLQARTGTVLRTLHAFVTHCQNTLKSAPADRVEAATELLKSASRCAIALDSLQSHVDLSLWPDILEGSFAFVANYQLLTTEVGAKAVELTPTGELNQDLRNFITENSSIITNLEEEFTKHALPDDQNAETSTAK